MKLLRLELQDFRQFRGRQEIIFADESVRNVTVLYGFNGSGKTTLLNALTWVLYGSLSADFLLPNQLINEETWSQVPIGGGHQSQVTLIFEHDSQTYRLTRSFSAQKPSADSDQVAASTSVYMTRIDQSGNSKEIKAPNDFVDNLLPAKLHHFFFLNGERFEHLHSDEAYADIESAIKTLLGVAVIERSLRHLPDAEKDLRREFSAIGGTDIEALNARIEAAEDDIRDAHERIDELDGRREARELELAEVESALRESEASMEHQKRRDWLESTFQKAEAEKLQAEEHRDQELSKLGFAAFIQPLIESTLSTYDSLRARKELPKPFKAQFIDDLLESGECICGSSLKEEGPCRNAVVKWKQGAGLPDVEEAWSALCGEGRMLLSQAHELREHLDRYTHSITRAKERLTEIEEELSEVSSRLTFSGEDSSELERRRKSLVEEDRRDIEDIGGMKQQLSLAESAMTEAKKGLEKASTQSVKARVAKRRVEVVESVIDFLNFLLQLRVEEVRQGLDKRVRETFESIVLQDYSTRLTEHFRLQLIKHVGGRELQVARSTGQGQILVLSFVGALAAMARERAEAYPASTKGGLQVATGGIFPLVSDAVFGTLEETYRRDIAQALPRLAPQVVIFVSKAQGLGVVEERLRTRIGKQYVLEVQTPKTEAVSETIELLGRSWPYVTVRPGEPEETKLVELGIEA